MKLLFVLLLFCVFDTIHSQVTYIGELDEKIVDFQYGNYFYKLDDLLIIKAEASNVIYSLGLNNGEFKQFPSTNGNITNFIETENGICFNSKIYSTTSINDDEFRISIINELGEIKIIDQIPYQDLYEDIGIQYFIKDTMYFQIKQNGVYNLYKYFEGNKILESSGYNKFYFHKLVDNKVFYTTLIGDKKYLFLKEGIDHIELAEINELYIEKIKTNDPYKLFFHSKLSNSTSQFNKFDFESRSLIKFSNEGFDNMFFENDTVFYALNNKYKIVSDTAVLVKKYHIKSELKSFSTFNNTYETSYLKFFDVPSKNAMYYSNINGMEIVKINYEDSLDILNYNENGRISSINFSSCGISYAEYFAKHFTFNNRFYICLPNIYDNKYYLYELNHDSLISIFSFNDIDINSLKFYPKDDYLFFSTYNYDTKKVKLYKRNWNLQNEIAPIEKDSNISNKTWYNEFGIDNLDYSCYLTGDNLVINEVFFDNELNSYSSFIDRKHGGLYSSSVFYDRLNDSLVLTEYPHSIVKHDEFGKLLWHSKIGYKYKFSSDYDKLLINKKGNPVVLGNYYKKGYFDNDSLTSLGSAIYFAELDKNSGNVLQKKNIQESAYVNDFNIKNAIFDNLGNLYVNFFYSNYSINIGNVTLLSDWNLQNAIIKLDENGNLIWAKNILNSASDYFSFSSNMTYDSLLNLLTIVYYQEGENFCGDFGWKSEIVRISAVGDVFHRDLFMNGTINQNSTKIVDVGENKFFIKGVYNGRINPEIFTNETIPDATCFQTENYELIYDSKQKRIVSAKTTKNNDFFVPYEVKKYKDTVYMLGIKKGSILAIQKFNNQGEYFGEIDFGYFSETPKIHFDIDENYIILIGNNFTYNSKHKVMPLLNHIYNVSLLKIENKNWSKLNYQVEQMDIYSLIENQDNISVFPNPVEDVCEINFNTSENILTDYSLSDMNGKILIAGKLENQSFLKLNLSNLEMGIYIINVFGENSRLNKKIVKL